MEVLYADASALVKLVLDEPESGALRAFVADGDLVTSALALTEVPRAVRRACAHDPRLPFEVLLTRATEVLESLGLVPVDDMLLAAAGALPEPALRALDAIHVATALDVAPVRAFVGYDERQSAAARLAGLRTVAPGGG